MKRHLALCLTAGLCSASFSSASMATDRSYRQQCTRIAQMAPYWLLWTAFELMQRVEAAGCKSYTETGTATVVLTPNNASDPNTAYSGTMTLNGSLECADYSSCFSARDTVEVRDPETLQVQTIPMSELKVGQYVRVGIPKDQTEPRYEPVLDFLHRNAEQKATFIRIKISERKYVLLTPTHLLQQAKKANDTYDPDILFGWIQAKDLRARDSVFYQGKPKLIRNTTYLEKIGIYAPLTPSCAIEVNGVGCSCLAEIPSNNWMMYAATKSGYMKLRSLLVSPRTSEDASVPVHPIDAAAHRLMMRATTDASSRPQ